LVDSPHETGDTFVRAIDYINGVRIDADVVRVILDVNARTLSGIG
jgi:hypothetical protein